MKIKILMITWLLFICGGISMVFSYPADAGEDIVRMDTSAFDRLRRPAAVFDHDSHNEAAQIDDCAVCHHAWENGKLVPDESREDTPCSESHGLIVGVQNPMPLANAFHAQC
ncbi:cytochrome c3 family protein [Desulfobacter hydrogenophilus]|nr:cytochrome c3 family protein [Desulfobacter hydrogenophilus]NDY72509.1 cytochrome c3 family protein [Desulfobacter hydrogenophilus]